MQVAYAPTLGVGESPPGSGLLAGGPFAAGLIASGLFASGLNAGRPVNQQDWLSRLLLYDHELTL